MPPGFDKRKTYGTVRRGSTARQSAFRGSVRAWDSQRNRPSGLLRQQPADARVDKENAAADTQDSRQPISSTASYQSDVDIDAEDSFVLESPPESPVVERISPVTPSIHALVPAKTCFQSERSPRPSAEQDVKHISSMPEPQHRRPLAPKSDNNLNVINNRQPSPSKDTSTPKKPIHKSKKTKGKRKNGKNKSRKTSTEIETQAEENITRVEDVSCSPLTTSEAEIPHTTSQHTTGDEERNEQPPAAVVSHPPSSPSTPLQRNRRHTARHLTQDKGTGSTATDSNTRSPITSGTPFAKSAIQCAPSPREIGDGKYVIVVSEEPAAEHDPVTMVDDDHDASDADGDDAVALSPKQRAELRKQARKRRGRKPEDSPLKHDLPNRFQSMAIGTPAQDAASSVGTSTEPSTTPTPSSTAASSVYVPSKPGTPIYIDQPFENAPLAPDSEVFNLVRSCDDKRLMTFDEFLRDISPDFSRIKKIGESSFAEVFLHRRDNGEAVVLKVVPLENEPSVQDVMQELEITRSLSPIDGFIKFIGCQVLSGGIPPQLETAWTTWSQKHEPERYTATTTSSISIFKQFEYHAVIALEDGGCCLEDCNWKTWDVPLEIFRQALAALATGERERRFEHRDLHGGNLLVRDLARERVGAAAEDTNVGRNVELGGFEGLKVTVIDYTLSRADMPADDAVGGPAFLDIPEDTFTAEGLYQFEIYRMMREEMKALGPTARKDNGDINWQTPCPRTNVVWLHFLTKILIRQDDGRRNGGKLHIVKPRATKKNEFELLCREKLLRIHDELNWGTDDRPVRPDFRGAVDVAAWCEKEGVFRVLDEERERRRVAREGGDVGGKRVARRRK
ncbi:hypothetical protein TWF696_002000 [Orbilia brochopaga]|uniref:non-specific serine/threonine protein kinase n=1 Tax=Orbilia brochopaga TaxID=3140254 RepID=A0AAV9U6I6_9PEZI